MGVGSRQVAVGDRGLEDVDRIDHSAWAERRPATGELVGTVVVRGQLPVVLLREVDGLSFAAISLRRLPAVV